MLAAIAVRRWDDSIFNTVEVASGFHRLDNLRARFFVRQAFVLATFFVNRAVRVQDVDGVGHLVLVAVPTGVVFGVVGRGEFYGSGPLVFLSQQSVGDNWNLATV